MYRSDFQKLAEDRLADARALFKARRYDAAFYLAGYVVECALKACIAKRAPRYQFPLKDVRDVYTHSFVKLLQAAGLTKSREQAMRRDTQLEKYWNGVIKDWSEESRYDRYGGLGKKKAADMIKAVEDPDHGVLQCIKIDW